MTDEERDALMARLKERNERHQREWHEAHHLDPIHRGLTHHSPGSTYERKMACPLCDGSKP